MINFMEMTLEFKNYSVVLVTTRLELEVEKISQVVVMVQMTLN